MSLNDLLLVFNQWVRPPLDILIISWLIYKTYKLLIKTQAIPDELDFPKTANQAIINT